MNINVQDALKKFGGSQEILNQEINTFLYQIVP